MITDYFKQKKLDPIINEYYELHRSFIEKKKFKKLYNETYSYLEINSSRKSCVCLDDNIKKTFEIYNLPLIDWTFTTSEIRNTILTNYSNLYHIDYGLVHYYNDSSSNISWHSDKEALKSNIYSVNIGGVRRFCLRNKTTKEVLTFDLYDGDLFVMKIGCQEKYEHCIKSIKLFNDPRFSVTFRQIESPTLYYTYYPLEIKIITSETCPDFHNYKKITETREKIIIGIVCDDDDNMTFSQIINERSLEISVSLIKSNLQKSIRRKLENVALNSTMAMIVSGNLMDLLRRLTIISIEDVCINKYYCIIVWYYIALSKNYKLTNFDVNFIFSYVKLLCSIDVFYENIDNNDFINDYKLNDLFNNVNCIALYLRLQFGGFNGEKILINTLITQIINGKIIICDDEIVISKYQIYEESMNELDILSSAIDFHCFPKMIEKILSKIINNNPNIELNEDDIRNYIWVYDSNVNLRNNNCNKNFKSMDPNIWNFIIKPKCDIYRFHIMKLLNLKKLL
jgi:hypothetical protein